MKTLNFIKVIVIICAIAELKTILIIPLPVATYLIAARSDKTQFVNPLKAVIVLRNFKNVFKNMGAKIGYNQINKNHCRFI